ncbi:MAG TPA: hypothetical protein VN461_01100 [Vicinamibacteria bacterium]|jgi:hypothetical protein|nr:hypothetical protein [Vicinamibacteria bacterium]
MRKWVLRTLGLAVLAILLWLGVGNLVAAYQEGRARRGWAEAGLSMEEFERQHPRTDANSLALAIEAKARVLGFELGLSSESRKKNRQPRALDSLYESDLLQFVSSQISRTDGGPIKELPPELDAFLKRNSTAIELLEAEILGSGEIVWARETPGVLDPSFPFSLRFRQLVDVLRLDALDKSRRGDAAGVDRALEAGWKLNSAYRDHPLVIGQFLAIAIDSNLLAVLRRLAPASDGWGARLAAHDYGRSFLASLQGELQSASAHVKGTEDAEAGLWCHFAGAFVAPFSRIWLASYSDLMRRAILQLRAQRDPCTLDLDSVVETLGIHPWNTSAREALPSLILGYAAATEAALNREVTSRVLVGEAPWLKEAGVRSSVCQSLVWKVEHDPNGAVILAPSRPLPRSLGNLVVRWPKPAQKS